MLILQSAKYLVALKSMLHRELPWSVSVYGGLLHIMNNNRCHLEMCVDSWPDFSTVICRRQKRVLSSHHKMLPNLCTLFTKDVASMRMMLMDGVIDCKGDMIISAVPSSCCGLIQEIASSNGMEVENVNICIQNNPKYIECGRSDLASKVSSLNVSHAELVCSRFAYGGNELTRNHVRSCIHNFPSCCILDEGGNPVSWSLMDELYSIRMAFTLPEYRKQGYMKTVTAALVNKANSLGLPVYCHVLNSNTASLNLVKCVGLTIYPEEYNVFALFVSPENQQGN
ncbi:glycine N-acyltransferase [Amia ocellicauda]|uniref:glycine N-acyltransferase n=1 Tax=Amia ocellicauda TaxID=2972642 RepID=UPI0034640BDF